LKDMRARRKSIEVNGVEILPEVENVCKPVDTRSDSSSSVMMTRVFLTVMANSTKVLSKRQLVDNSKNGHRKKTRLPKKMQNSVSAILRFP